MHIQMINKPPLYFFLAFFLLVSHAVNANEIRSTQHPLIGYWEAIDEKNACKETYQFLGNGQAEFSSGNEKLSVTYSVDPQPDENGFFKMKHKVISSNNQEDCTRSKSDIGLEKMSYLLFQPDGYSFIACDNDDASLETCFGPMQLRERPKPN